MSKSIYSLYKTTNHINGKVYFGVHHETRWPNADRYLGSGQVLKQAINKYGRENFERTVLCIAGSKEYVLELEKRLVDEEVVKSSETYNITGGGHGSILLQEESVEKIRQARLGGSLSKETIEKRTSSRMRTAERSGYFHSEETKKKIGDANRGRVFSKDHREKLSAALKGRTYSEETRMLRSVQRKGRTVSNETRQKLSQAAKRRPPKKPISEETREKLKRAQKARRARERQQNP